MATSSQTVVGVFATRMAAESAYRELRLAGYRDDQIGLVGKHIQTKGGSNPTDDTNAGEGLAVGVGAGAVAGAAVGWAVLAGAIPVIGPAIAAGTLGVVLSNALAGAAVAGVAGALIGWGIPEEDAKMYEEEVNAGHYLVTVNDSEERGTAHAIIARNGGVERAMA